MPCETKASYRIGYSSNVKVERISAFFGDFAERFRKWTLYTYQFQIFLAILSCCRSGWHVIEPYVVLIGRHWSVSLEAVVDMEIDFPFPRNKFLEACLYYRKDQEPFLRRSPSAITAIFFIRARLEHFMSKPANWENIAWVRFWLAHSDGKSHGIEVRPPLSVCR